MILSAGVAAALLTPSGGSPSVLTPNALCKTASSTWAFCNSSDMMGDASNTIANGRFTLLNVGNLSAATMTVSGVSAGNLDMGNNLMLNIGNSGTDFTSGGGLTIAGTFIVGGNTFSGTISSTTVSIGGYALLAGACTSTVVAMSGATTTDKVVPTPRTYPGDGIYWNGYVSATNAVTVKVCAILALTPTASIYDIVLIK